MVAKRITYKRIGSKCQIFAADIAGGACYPVLFDLKYNLFADSNSKD
jgi:hypothetical protein